MVTTMRSITMSESDVTRFWSKVDQSGGPDACWPWTGGRLPDEFKQYGLFWLDGQMTRAHRVACHLGNGPLGESNALHSCDNPPCCNPRHLFKGTTLDNAQDCVAKGRKAVQPGSSNGNAKIDEETARNVYVACAAGMTQREAAKKFSISQGRVSKIVLRKAWAHATTAEALNKW